MTEERNNPEHKPAHDQGLPVQPGVDAGIHVEPGLPLPVDHEAGHALDHRVVRGSSWVAVSYGARSLLSMVSMLALVRLLDPQAFGLVALASIFVAIVEHVQAGGITAALIYRRDDVRRAAASGLLFTVTASLALYGILVAGAPLLSSAFHADGLTSVLRALGLLLVVRGFAAVPIALLERELDFRSLAKTELAAGLSQVTISVSLAFAGAGVWSLVAGQVGASAVQVALLWWLVPWRPRLRDASLKVLRELLRYGRFVSAGIILGIVNDSVDKVIVGRLLGTKPLGIYAVTYRLADFPTSVIGYVVGRVMLPAYASVQGDRALFRRAFVQNLQRVALLSLPVGVGLAVGAEPLVRGLLGERWLPVVTPLRILAAYSIVRSFASCAGPPFQALGKPHLVPIFALPQTLVTIPALLLLTPSMGVNGAALAMLIGFSCSGIPAFAYALHLIGLSSIDVLRALGASLLSSALLAAALAGLLWANIPLPAFGNLVLLAIAGLLVYGVATALFARSTIAPIWASLRGTRSVTQ